MNFFTRVKKAIFKFDDYEKFIVEPTAESFKYFFKLILIFALIITITLVFRIYKESEIAIKTIKNEFPQFTIMNNELELENNQDFEYFFEKLNLNIIMSEKENVEKNDLSSKSLILLKDKMIIKYDGINQELFYKDVLPEDISKDDILSTGYSKEIIWIYISVFLMMFLISFTLYSVIIFVDIITLMIFGMVINLIIRTSLRYKDVLKISIYSITLPIILYLVYIVANILFGITIKYFEIAYNSIAYIYLVTVLLIMKSDIIKNTQELQNILEEQKKVKEELEREKQEEKEKQEEANKEPKKQGKEKSKKNPEGEPQTEN